MEQVRKVMRSGTFARHAASLGGGRIAASGVSAVWLIVAARSLPVSGFGDLATLLSVGAILMTLADLGIPFLLADAVARSGRVTWRTIVTVTRRRLAAGAVMAMAAGGAYLVVASDRRVIVPLVFSVSLLATVVHSTMTAAMRGLGRFSIESANDVFSRVGVLAAGVVVLAGGGGLLGVVAVYATADLLSVVVVAVLVSRHASDNDDIDAPALTSRRNAPMAVGRFLATLYYRVDLWLIALIRGTAAAGAYGAPYRLLDAVLLLPRAMGAVAVTHGGQRQREGVAPQSPKRIAIAAAGLVAVVAIPCMALAEPLVRVTFGERYLSSVSVLVVLMASAIPGAVTSVLMPLAAIRDGRRFGVAMGVALAVNVLFNVVLIPFHGPIAAAWTTLMCQTALSAWLYRMLATDPTGSDGVVPQCRRPVPGDVSLLRGTR